MTGTNVVSLRKRKGGSRSRTGCVICRQRHIKCDEAKPCCEQCRAAGWKCEYQIKYCVGKAGSCADIEPPSGDQQRFHALITLNTDPHISSEERQALVYFSEAAAGDIFGYLISDFWTSFVPQRFNSAPVIRSALVALSAIHRDFVIACDATSPSTTVIVPARSKSDRLYGNAVTHLHTYIRDTPGPLKAEVLIVCLLLICCMLLRRNPEEAIQHLDMGAAIVRSWKEDLDFFGPNSKNDIERRDFEKIADTFCALDVHATAYNDTRAPTLSFLNQDCTDLLESGALHEFKSLGHAQQTFIHLLNTAVAHIFRSVPYKFTPIHLVPRQLITQRQTIRKAFNTWLNGLGYLEMGHFLWHPDLSVEARKARTAIAAMRTQHLAIQILLDETLSKNRIASFSCFEAQALRLIHWAEIAVNESTSACSADATPLSGRRTFSIDLGLGPPLFLLIVKPFCPAIRSRAISLLSRVRRLEGWLDPTALVRSIRLVYESQSTEGFQHSSSRLSDASSATGLTNLGSTVQQTIAEMSRSNTFST